MAICAVAWLVAHVRMLGRDEREKPQTMIRQLVTPLYGENTLQFYNERYRHTHSQAHDHMWMNVSVSFVICVNTYAHSPLHSHQRDHYEFHHGAHVC